MVRQKGQPRAGELTVDCARVRAVYREATEERRRNTRIELDGGPLARLMGTDRPEQGGGRNISKANVELFARLIGVPLTDLLWVGEAATTRQELPGWATTAKRGTGTGPDGVQTWLSYSPFPGLRSLDARDSDLFYGREQQVKAACRQLKAAGMLWVTGPSGNGKSSLVNAGMVPALLRAGSKPLGWKTTAMTPGRTVLRNLYHALVSLFPLLGPGREHSRLMGTATAFVASALAGEIDLGGIISRVAGHDVDTDYLLVIDQFEEVFVLSDPGEANALYRLVNQVADLHMLHVVATIRHDFLRHLIETPALASTLNSTTFFTLNIPRRDELREMIEGPALRAGLELEEGLIERILDDTGDEPGALALMAYTLDELYKARQGNVLELVTYDGLGGVMGAISERAEETYQDRGGNEPAFQELFGRLVEVNEEGIATRKRMREDEELSSAAKQLLTAFIDARLVSTSSEHDHLAAVYEVAHEAVFREWPRLRDWISETREFHSVVSRVEREARNWDKQGRPVYLLPNQEIIEAFEEAETRLFRASAARSEVLRAFLRSERERLLEALHDPTCSHQHRREIGDRLAAIGDERRGVGVRDGLPDFLWATVGAGPVLTAGIEKHSQQLLVAVYPVTTVQFDAFLSATDGYSDIRNWEFAPEELRKQLLRPERNPNSNSPRDTVSWYQARAFAKWLDRRLVGATLTSIDSQVTRTISDANEVRLPTEWEWQRAAQGGELARYPWGEWMGGLSNTAEAELGRSVAVGMYPRGAARNGALDLAGNVAEWCLTNHDLSEPDFDRDCSKILKGGSYYHGSAHAAVDFRRRMPPANAFSNFGFRLVVGPRLPHA